MNKNIGDMPAWQAELMNGIIYRQGIIDDNPRGVIFPDSHRVIHMPDDRILDEEKLVVKMERIIKSVSVSNAAYSYNGENI